MEKITSFTIDHIKLQPGLYVSRKDKVGTQTVTTFDLRLTNPNEEPVMRSPTGRRRACLSPSRASIPPAH